MDHIFLHCHYTSCLWNWALQDLSLSLTMPQSIKECFLPNLGTLDNNRIKHVWRTLMDAVIWSIWLERNKTILKT